MTIPFSLKHHSTATLTLNDFNNISLTDTERASNQTALIEFALTNLQAVIEHEKRRFGKTSLEIYARIGVSIVFNPSTSRFSFMVNEIERLSSGCFWHVKQLPYVPSEPIEARSKHIATSLCDYIKSIPFRLLRLHVDRDWTCYTTT